MKRILLFIAAGLMMTITAQGTEIDLKESNDFKITDSRYKLQPVLFTYNNVDYAIYANGNIKFELPKRNVRSSNRRGVNRRYNLNSVSNYSTYDKNFVRYNRQGQAVKIGNTRIYYNSKGDVTRVGNIKIAYRNGVLRKVGGLKVQYNRRGQIISSRGHV